MDWEECREWGVPWKKSSVLEERERFVRAALSKSKEVAKLCREFGIARVSAYRWLKRFEREGLEGLKDRARGPVCGAKRPQRQKWEPLVVALRGQHRRWGSRKLLAILRRQYPRSVLPSARSVARWLREAGCVGKRKSRSVDGPQLPMPKRASPRCVHAIWTVDFKGHFRTGDGALCRPLTVRDLYSRYVLLAEHVSQPSDAVVRLAMTRCFKRHGLPRWIRVDNGAPFAGVGALQLSRLSAWWMQLGIRVEFTRRGKPQDNGAHEQMHRVLKEETANPPAANLKEQAWRMARFCHWYNHQRPHEALGMRTPAELYRSSSRPYVGAAAPIYPKDWQVRKANRRGGVQWGGRVRFLGRAFACQSIGLKPKVRVGKDKAPIVEVYLGRQLIGELHQNDKDQIRAARWKRPSSSPEK